jgi:hypothetical protein
MTDTRIAPDAARHRVQLPADHDPAASRLVSDTAADVRGRRFTVIASKSLATMPFEED